MTAFCKTSGRFKVRKRCSLEEKRIVSKNTDKCCTFLSIEDKLNPTRCVQIKQSVTSHTDPNQHSYNASRTINIGNRELHQTGRHSPSQPALGRPVVDPGVFGQISVPMPGFDPRRVRSERECQALPVPTGPGDASRIEQTLGGSTRGPKIIS